jgi:hypothetical protein
MIGCALLFRRLLPVTAALLILFTDVVVGLNRKKHAIVTLVMGSDTGYISGAVALGQSLVDVASQTRRVCMVTPDVPAPSREDLAQFWEVRVVEPVYCNHKHKLDPKAYNLEVIFSEEIHLFHICVS